MSIIKSGTGFLFGCQQGKFYGQSALAIFTSMRVTKKLLDAAPGINETGYPVIAAAEQGQAVFYGAKYRIGHMLPLLRTVPKPPVIG